MKVSPAPRGCIWDVVAGKVQDQANEREREPISLDGGSCHPGLLSLPRRRRGITVLPGEEKSEHVQLGRLTAFRLKR
jgi:hypothetical protein